MSTTTFDTKIDVSCGSHVVFKNLCCIGRDRKTSKQILHNVTGVLPRNSLVAVMGNSGSGKSTLLKVLARRKDSADVSGEILCDGKKQTGRTKYSCGYLPQEDMLIMQLTVKENLLFSAKLRLPSTSSQDEVNRRVKSTIEELNLTGVANMFASKLSGGERRRLHIGLELLREPGLLILDEPTSGLDSHTAMNLLLVLRNLVNRGRTVILSIHQPRHSIFSMFDELILLNQGKCVYGGPASVAVEYFKVQGYEAAIHDNPADWLLDIMNQSATPDPHAFDQSDENMIYRQLSYCPTRQAMLQEISSDVPIHLSRRLSELTGDKKYLDVPSASLETSSVHVGEKETSLSLRPGVNEIQVAAVDNHRLANAYVRSLQYQRKMNEVEKAGKTEIASKELLGKTPDYETSFARQVYLIAQRRMTCVVRDPNPLIMTCVLFVSAALLTGILYFQLGFGPHDLQNYAGVLFFIITTVVGAASQAYEVFYLDRQTFLNEQLSGYYRSEAHFFATATVDIIIFRVLPMFIYVNICYWMVGLKSTFLAYFQTMITIQLVGLVSVAINYYLSCSIQSRQIAGITQKLIFTAMMIFGGLFININTIPAWLRWLQWLSLFRYSMEIVAVVQLEDVTFDCVNCMDGNTYLAAQTFDSSRILLDYGVLAMFIVVYCMWAAFHHGRLKPF
eukprot:CFRG7093T1